MVQAGYKYAPVWEDELAATQPQAGRMVRKTVKKKANSDRKLLGKIGIGVFVYGLLLVFLCIKSATLGYEIVHLENDIKELQNANSRIEYQIAEMTSLARIEKVAQNELNMYKPDRNIKVAVSNNIASSSDGSGDGIASINLQANGADIEGSSLEKLYASLMQLAYNN